MAKILWCDTETSGLDVVKHDIIRLAAVMEIDGKEMGSLDIKLRPGHPENIDDQALSVNKLTREEILTYPPAEDGHRGLLQFLSRYINKYDRSDKAFIAGKNVAFDVDRIRELFRRCNDPYFGSWFYPATIEVQTTMAEALISGAMVRPWPADFKLGTWCEALGIGIAAHDAMSDIRATRALYYLLKPAIIGATVLPQTRASAA